MTSFALDIREEVIEMKNQVSIMGEVSTFTLEDGSLEGSGIRLDFTHYFNDKVSLEVFMSTALSAQGDVSTSFTGLGAYFNYVVYGDCCKKIKNVFTGGELSSTETTSSGTRVVVGFGLDQYLLNGNRNVYSTSGPGFNAAFYFPFWKFTGKFSAKFSQMITDEEKVSGTFLGLGLTFDL